MKSDGRFTCKNCNGWIWFVTNEQAWRHVLVTECHLAEPDDESFKAWSNLPRIKIL